MKNSLLKTALNGLIGILISCTAWASAIDPIEVVQSVPLETTLAMPGIRQTQEVWLELIQSAKVSLDIEQFYVSDQRGQALEPVIQAIREATKRGVRVRLLVDAKFYKTYPDTVTALGLLPGAESRTIDFSSFGGIQHAKFFVVDGRQSFVGSQNFDWRALSHIHEIGLRVADPKIAADLKLIFERDWATGKTVNHGSAVAGLHLFSEGLMSSVPLGPLDLWVVASPAQVNPAGIPDSLTAITTLMRSAHHSISIQVMEYSTSVFGQTGTHWRVLDDAIRAAAGSGVHVQLLLDVGAAKKAKADLRALALVPGVEVRSVTIPTWSGGAIDFARLIHGKYVVIDGGTTAWVGSENWSKGYFTDTRNVGFLVSAPAVAGQLGQVFARVWGSLYAAPVTE